MQSIKLFLGIMVLGLLLSSNAYAEDALTVNGLLKEGFKITKEELVKNFNQLRKQEINKFIKIVDQILGEYVKNNAIDSRPQCK